MKKLICISLLITHYALSWAQSLSPNAKVSLLTVSAGDELYSAFGHSALWIQDYERGIDRVYNYGTFDFGAEGFYLKFVRGTLPYTLSVSNSYSILEGSRQSNRSVYEQTLNLSANQKEKLFAFLENNYLPENRLYHYKFFYDNCSTRLRDALQVACGDSLRFESQSVSNRSGKSFREWMNDHLSDFEWVGLAMNIAIGAPSDQICTPQQEMYLPDNLKIHIEKAKLGNQKLEKTASMVIPKIEVKPANIDFSFLFNPHTILLVILLLFFNKRVKDLTFPKPWLSKAILVLTGLFGVILLPLWLLTDHGVTNWNLSLLIFFPTNLIAAFFINKPAHYQWIWKYFLVCLGLLVLWFGLFAAYSTSHAELFPLVTISAILAGFYYRLMKRYQTNS